MQLFLSDQETDYMALIFHFYNSDDESDADSDIGDPRFKTRTKKNVGKKPVEDEKELKLQQLKDQKSEYKPGEWNPRSVLMGGLGKDPEIEVVKTAESSARLTAPTSEELKRSPKSKTKVMRRSSTRAHAKIGDIYILNYNICNNVIRSISKLKIKYAMLEKNIHESVH